MTPRHIVFDIDGTLVSWRGGAHVPDETHTALRLLRERGHVPAIATGRGAFLARGVAEELGIEHMICAGGAHVLISGETVHMAWLPDGALGPFLELSREHPRITAAMDDRHVYTANDDAGWAAYLEGQAGGPCIRPLAELGRALVCYLMVAPPLSRAWGMFSSPPDGVMIDPMHGFVEARAVGTSKWAGIQILAGRRGLSTDDVVTFGDGANDVGMLEEAPMSVAPAGASEGAKRAAKIICPDIDEGGILWACRELGLV